MKTKSAKASKGGTLWIVLVLVAVLAGLAASRVSAQNYSIDWFTIDGGGGTSTGGVYAVSGTIGQPDAGGLMTNGPYALVGGFWSIIAIQTPGAPPLSIEHAAGGVRVFWPLPATDFVLDQGTALVSPPAPNSWSQVPFPYQTNTTHISISVPSPASKKFYRLRKL